MFCFSKIEISSFDTETMVFMSFLRIDCCFCPMRYITMPTGKSAMSK